MRILLWVILTLLTGTGASQSRTWHILPDGGGDAPSIQAGISAAAHYDTVLVAPGTYHEAIDFASKKIVVGSYFLTTQDTTYITQTVIDAEGTYQSAVSFIGGEERSAILCGLTLTRGHGTWWGYHWGGGVFCLGTSPTLRHLIIRDCMAVGVDEFGGGIAVLGGRPLIDQVHLENNAAGEGGGIQCEGPEAHPIIRNTFLTGNVAGQGAGISLYGGASAILENVVIHGNLAAGGSGWGINCGSNSQVTLIRCSVIENQGGGIQLIYGGSAMLIDSILWTVAEPEIRFYPGGDTSSLVVTHCDVDGGLAGIQHNGTGTIEWLAGNIDQNPQFVNIDNGDLRLSTGSPCIDAGIDYFEWDDEIILDLEPDDYCGSVPDMGALEFCPQPVPVRGAAVPPARLSSVYPNPCNPQVTISFTLNRIQHVTISIFDLIGRRLAVIGSSVYTAGHHTVSWSGRDEVGRCVASGTYWVRLELSGWNATRKIQLIR